MSIPPLTKLEQLTLSRKPFPFESLIDMCYAAHYECCCNYFEGTKLLVEWLSPIAAPLPTPKYSNHLLNWEIMELAYILAPKTTNTSISIRTVNSLYTDAITHRILTNGR